MSKKLLVYFSRNGENTVDGKMVFFKEGNTKILAEKIVSHLGDVDVKEITAVNPYSRNYDECNRRAKYESDSGLFPSINEDIDISGYEDIYIGFPLWYRTFPRVIATFLKNNKGKWFGKKVHPFCTNEEGYTGIVDIELGYTITGAIIESAFSVKGSEVELEKTDKEVKEWLNK